MFGNTYDNETKSAGFSFGGGGRSDKTLYVRTPVNIRGELAHSRWPKLKSIYKDATGIRVFEKLKHSPRSYIRGKVWRILIDQCTYIPHKRGGWDSTKNQRNEKHHTAPLFSIDERGTAAITVEFISRLVGTDFTARLRKILFRAVFSRRRIGEFRPARSNRI